MDAFDLSRIDFAWILFIFTIFIICGSIHEYAHAATALYFGDPTAEREGRLTFNPFAHIDIVGTVVIPLLTMIASSLGTPIFIPGWMKPVPVNPYLLRPFRVGYILVAAAGPASNFVLAGAGAVLYQILHQVLLPGDPAFRNTFWFVFVNLGLALFNLIPIHPLDGSRILAGLLPREMSAIYERHNPVGPIILIAAMYLGITNVFIGPPMVFLIDVLMPR